MGLVGDGLERLSFWRGGTWTKIWLKAWREPYEGLAERAIQVGALLWECLVCLLRGGNEVGAQWLEMRLKRKANYILKAIIYGLDKNLRNLDFDSSYNKLTIVEFFTFSNWQWNFFKCSFGDPVCFHLLGSSSLCFIFMFQLH